MFGLKSAIPKVVKIANDPIKVKAFKAANEAMAELFTAGIIGDTCVRQQFLTAPMVQSLSKTCFTILLPMFLFTSIMRTVQANGGRLTKNTMMIPFIAIFHCIIVNFIMRYFLLPLVNMDSKSDEGRSTLVCCTFGNSGVIPLIFAEALFRHNVDVLQKAYSFVSLYLVGWSPFFWSFGRFSLLGSVHSNQAQKSKFDLWKVHEDRSMMTIIYDQVTFLKSLFPPPVIGVLTGLLIASIPLLRNLFMGENTVNGENKPILGVVFNSLQNLGRAANPLALLVLTSSLAFGRMKEDQNEGSSNVKTNSNTTSSSHSTMTLVKRLSCVSIARFIISPLLMMIILRNTIGSLDDFASIRASGSHDDGIIAVSENSMIWFILMLQSCMPPAQNSVLMLQVAEKTREASTMAKFLFSIYSLAMIPIVLISTTLLEKCQLTQV